MWDAIKRRLRSNTWRKALLTLTASAAAYQFPKVKAFIADNIVAIMVITGALDAGIREKTTKPISER